MYSKVATAAAIFAFIAVTEAKLNVEAIKKTIDSETARIQARTRKTMSANKVAKRTQRLGKSVQTSPTYVTISTYGSADCSNTQPVSAIIYGTNMCLAVSDVSAISSAASTQYTWDSTNNMLNEVYYSDAACTTAVGMGTVLDFTSDDTAGTCTSGFEYSTSSTYSFPGTGYAVE
jgi:hypothetical protein